MQSWLTWFLRGILILGFLALFAKLFEVQIIKGDYYRKLAEENRIKHIPIPASRGKILARGGETLEGENFAHITGYLSRVNGDEIDKIDPNCPEKGIRKSEDQVGRTGLQEEYQCLLEGVPGEELIEVDTLGKKIRTLGRHDPVPGHDIKTTIDYGLQLETAYDMAGKKGAAIVIDTRGQILAFYSGPSFDPVNIKSYLNDSDLPLFNRVISGTFHPGSVFKPLVSLSALEEGVIDKNFVFDDPGVIMVNEFSYSNWYFSEFGRLEGTIGLTRALARSTDTFFYKIGEMTGPENIAKWAQRFGLDKKTEVDLPGETSGLIPTPGWKKKIKNEPWFLGNTYHMSIGQGDVSLTPIEVNTYISAIALNGQLCKPYFVDGEKCEQLNIKKENLDLIKEGMRQACTIGGTGYTFFDFSPGVACKTGTAEVGIDGIPHAWFTLFYPIDNPQIVTTILIEKGGQGSSIAGPIARKIMDYYVHSR